MPRPSPRTEWTRPVTPPELTGHRAQVPLELKSFALAYDVADTAPVEAGPGAAGEEAPWEWVDEQGALSPL